MALARDRRELLEQRDARVNFLDPVLDNDDLERIRQKTFGLRQLGERYHEVIRAPPRFVMLVGILFLIMLGSAAVTTVHLWIKRRIQVSWREWLTDRLLNEWMTSGRQGTSLSRAHVETPLAASRPLTLPGFGQ